MKRYCVILTLKTQSWLNVLLFYKLFHQQTDSFENIAGAPVPASDCYFRTKIVEKNKQL